LSTDIATKLKKSEDSGDFAGFCIWILLSLQSSKARNCEVIQRQQQLSQHATTLNIIEKVYGMGTLFINIKWEFPKPVYQPWQNNISPFININHWRE